MEPMRCNFFRLPGYKDIAPDGITRTSSWKNSKYIANRPSVSFRALYQGNNTQFSSTCDWAYEGTRIDRRSGALQYTPSLFDVNKWDINNPSRENSIRWDNDFFQNLPNNWALSASFQLAYDHITQTQVRSESDITVRDLTAREKIWGTASEIGISRPFTDTHNVSLELKAITYNSKIDYISSTSDKNNTSHLLFLLGVSYTFQPNKKLYTRLGLYATYYSSKTSDVEENKWYPTVKFNLNWLAKQRHRLGVSINYTINTPNGSQTNAVLLQMDMLKWSQGNPKLRSYQTLSTLLSYTWNPSQYINISPMAAWIYKHNYFADTYSLTEDEKGIMVKPENCGNYHNAWAAINFSAYTFNRNLVIELRPAVSYHKFIGMFNQSYTTFAATLNATYYWDKFFLGASYSSPETYFNQADPIKRKVRSQYWLMAGWGNSSWTVSAFLINPFRSDWNSDILMIDTPDYSMKTTSISVNDHRRINFTVAYTFGYGKKVQRGDDLQESSGNTSSIRL